MDSSENEFIYSLKKPFEYHSGGEIIMAQFITLCPPTMKHMEHREPILQAFYQAISEQDSQGDSTDSNSNSNSNVKIRGSDILALLRVSEKVSTHKVGLHFIELLSSKGIALIDGTEKVNKQLIDKMDPVDFDEIMGEYLSNFIVASLLDKTEKQSG